MSVLICQFASSRPDEGLSPGRMERLILPREGRMSHDDGHIRKVDRDIIQVHGVGILEPHATSTTRTTPDARMPGMKYCRQPGLRDYFVEDIGTPIIGIEFLQGGV